MYSKIKYKVQSSKEYLGEREININSLTPNFDTYEEKKIREDVSNSLFKVFKKYIENKAYTNSQL